MLGKTEVYNEICNSRVAIFISLEEKHFWSSIYKFLHPFDGTNSGLDTIPSISQRTEDEDMTQSFVKIKDICLKQFEFNNLFLVVVHVSKCYMICLSDPNNKK